MNDKGTIMVLPGTKWQIPLVKRIKEKGYRVAVVHPYPDAPAFAYADDVVLADILDQEKCLEAARKLNVVAVMSDECDIATPTLAYVSSRLELPSQGEEMAKLFTDKVLMRDFCKQHGFPYPEYQLCGTLDEALEFFRSLGKKMIIKPIDANSSRGVYTIDSEEDLIRHFDEAIGYSHHRHAVVCERYISGPEFVGEGIMMPTGHVCLAVSVKDQFTYNRNLDSRVVYSYFHDDYDYDQLRKVYSQMMELTGLPFGFTHIEFKYEDGEFYLIEFAARGGGNLSSSHVAPALSGIDSYSLLIDMFTGSPITQIIRQDSLVNEKAAIIKFFDATAQGGVVESVEGADYLMNNPSVLAHDFNFKIGDCIHRPADGGGRVGYYVACCPNMESLMQLEAEVDKRVVIHYKE